ncbi:hypothetical protein BJ165DRAFT_1001884 [Panaeolus papilionaceus]|nr:hypothetical protein BJ165DRAFT_1001884 [Panaeolus papilionaceus]
MDTPSRASPIPNIPAIFGSRHSSSSFAVQNIPRWPIIGTWEQCGVILVPLTSFLLSRRSLLVLLTHPESSLIHHPPTSYFFLSSHLSLHFCFLCLTMTSPLFYLYPTFWPLDLSPQLDILTQNVSFLLCVHRISQRRCMANGMPKGYSRW